MDACSFQFLWECEGVVVGGVWSFGETEGAADDDGGVCGDEQVGAEVGIAAADDDRLEIVIECPVDRVCDLVEGVGTHEDWVLALAFKNRCDGIEPLVCCRVRLGVGGGLSEYFVEGVGVVVS